MTSTAPMDLTSLEEDPRLFLYTSLTAGSSHIITATSRLETILKANRIPFQAIDIATDEKARKLWQRRAGQKKIPGLVKEGYVIGDLEEVEEWNEFGEMKENIGPVPDSNAPLPSGAQTGVNIAPPHLPVIPTATAGTANIGPSPSIADKGPKPLVDSSKMRPLPGAAEIAARNESKATGASEEADSAAPSAKGEPVSASSVIEEPIKAETMTSPPATKEESLKPLRKIAKDHPSIAHLSAPGSAIQSGVTTPVVSEAAGTEEAKAKGSATDEGAEKPKEVKSESVAPGGKAAGEAAVPKSKDDDEDEEDEDDDEDDEDETEDKATDATKAVQGLQVGEGVKTQEQEAKQGNDATKSVED